MPDAARYALAGAPPSGPDDEVTPSVLARLGSTGPDVTALVQAVLDGSRDELDALVAALVAEDRAGEDRAGQDRAGEDRAGQDRTGEDGAGEERVAGREVVADRAAQDRTSGRQAAEDRTAEHLAAERARHLDRTGEHDPAVGPVGPAAVLATALAATGLLARRMHPLSGAASRLPDETEDDLLAAYAGLLVTRAEVRRARSAPRVTRDVLLATSRQAAAAAPRAVRGWRAGPVESLAALRASGLTAEEQLRAACVLLAQTCADGGGDAGRLAVDLRSTFPSRTGPAGPTSPSTG